MSKRRSPRRLRPFLEKVDPGLRGLEKKYCRCGKLALTKEDAQRRAEVETLAGTDTTGIKKGVYKCKLFPDDPWWHTYTIKGKNGSQKKRAKRRREETEAVLERARELYGLREKEKDT